MNHFDTVIPGRTGELERLRAVEQERDVLRHLVAARQGALVLWDDRLHAVWISPQAADYMARPRVRDALERAASTFLRIDGAKSVPYGYAPLGRTRVAWPPGDVPLLAEFSSVRTSHAGFWILVQLADHREDCPRFASLSGAERRVLYLLMAGLSNREIGIKLFISQETAKTHVSRILQKLEVTSRAKAASLGRQAGFDLTREESDELLAPARAFARRDAG